MTYCINCGLTNSHFNDCPSKRAERIRGYVAPAVSVPDDLSRIKAELLASDDPDDREAAVGLDGIAESLEATFSNLLGAVNDYENSIEP